MKLVRKVSKDTYVDSNGKERHYVNYYLCDDNGHSVCIRCAFPKRKADLIRLDTMSVYEK